MDLEEMQELQQVDLQRDDAKRVLQMVVEQITDPPFVEALDGEVEAQALLSLTAARESREAEAIVGTAQRRIQASDDRLYGGTITDHRTLEELQRDLYSQRQNLGPLSDANLAARQGAEEATTAERWLRDFREQALAIWNTRQTQLRTERDEAQAHVDDLSVLVEQRRVHLNESDLRTYDEYRQRRPRVVAGVAGGVCEECRLTLPTMIITRARRADRPIECPSCGCLVRVA